jgi:hypothetical protein
MNVDFLAALGYGSAEEKLDLHEICKFLLWERLVGAALTAIYIATAILIGVRLIQ